MDINEMINKISHTSERPEQLIFQKTCYTSDDALYEDLGKVLQVLCKLNCACLMYKNIVTNDIILEFKSIALNELLPVWVTPEELAKLESDSNLSFDDTSMKA